MKQYLDHEYDRIVDESVPKAQYDWFRRQNWFSKTYEQFLEENFTEIGGQDSAEFE